MKTKSSFKINKLLLDGFTLVELLVTLAILAIVLGSIWGIFNTQAKHITSITDVSLNIGEARSLLKLIENDFILAGFGVPNKKLTFYIKDNTESSDQWSDLLYISDWHFIGGDEMKTFKNSQQIVAKIESGSGQQNITVNKLNLDDFGMPKKKLRYPNLKEFVRDPSDAQSRTTTNYDNCYGDNCTDDCQSNGGGICSDREFAGRIWQTIISDAGVNKVAKINSISGSTLTLDRPISGSQVFPAIYYCLDQGNNTECDSNSATSFIFKSSDRTTGGRQPLANDIVDFQVAYQDLQNNWYCDGNGPCPMVPFDPEKIKKVRISILGKIQATKQPDKVKMCEWLDIQNKRCRAKDGSSTNATCISIENGEPWGCEYENKKEMEKNYYSTSLEMIPWNSVMENYFKKQLNR